MKFANLMFWDSGGGFVQAERRSVASTADLGSISNVLLLLQKTKQFW